MGWIFVISGKVFAENDSADLSGQLLLRHDLKGDKYYELEMRNKIQREAELNKNKSFQLKFGFVNFECGINVFKHPIHKFESKLNYNGSLDTAIYTYIPEQDFVGIDKVVFITGCGFDENSDVDTVEYLLKVSDVSLIKNTTDFDFDITPNHSGGIINIKQKNNQDLNFIIYNILGRKIQSGKLKQEIHADLSTGVYVFVILDSMQPIYKQKIMIVQ